MKLRSKLIIAVLWISCLCGCGTFGIGKLDDLTTEPRLEIDYSIIKDGYYLSNSDDGSYYLIKDGKLSHVGFDFEKYYRETYPRGDETVSEYEERVSVWVEENIRDRTDKPFTPVKYVNYPEGTPYAVLVTDPPPEEITSNGFGGLSGVAMKDENTIGTEPPFYVYCGTSLPENLQTQTSD